MALTSEPKLGAIIYIEGDGIGTVIEVSDDPAQLLIEYDNGSKKRVPFGLHSSRPVAEHGFLVKTTRDAEGVQSLLRAAPDEIILMLLVDSPDTALDTKRIKSTLVPKWISEAEWEKWWRATQIKLKENPLIDTSQARQQRYALRSEGQQRARELLNLLRQAGDSPTMQFGYLRELVELHQKNLLELKEVDQVRSRLDWLAKSSQLESWVRISALSILADHRWIDMSRFEKELSGFCDTPVRWRPVTNARHLQRALHSLLNRCDWQGTPPAAIWSALLALPRHAEWLLNQLVQRDRPDELNGALAAVLAAAFPPTPPMNAEPSWVFDLLRVISEFRKTGEPMQVTALDWTGFAEILVSRIRALKVSDLGKTGMQAAAVNVLKTAAAWHTPDGAEGMEWIIDRLLQPDTPVYLQTILGEAVLTLEDPVIQSIALSHLIAIAPNSAIDGLLSETASSNAGDGRDQVRLLHDIVQTCAGRLSELPRLAGSILSKAESLADRVTDDSVGILLSVVQAVGAQNSPYRSRASRFEVTLWRRFLAPILAGAGLDAGVVPLLPGPHFAQAARELVQETAATRERERLLLQKELVRLGEQLVTAQNALAAKDRQIDELRRSVAQSLRPAQNTTDVAGMLTGLATILAEVERTAHRQKLRPDASGQLLYARLQRWTRQLGLSPLGQIGQTVMFDPGLHEIIDGVLGPGRHVEVLESGYQHLDDDGRTQCVKHALVRATGA